MWKIIAMQFGFKCIVSFLQKIQNTRTSKIVTNLDIQNTWELGQFTLKSTDLWGRWGRLVTGQESGSIWVLTKSLKDPRNFLWNPLKDALNFWGDDFSESLPRLTCLNSWAKSSKFFTRVSKSLTSRDSSALVFKASSSFSSWSTWQFKASKSVSFCVFEERAIFEEWCDHAKAQQVWEKESSVSLALEKRRLVK